MKNQLREVGLEYMRQTYYALHELLAEHGEEGQPGEPLKFKIYRDVASYALSQSLPLTLGDLRWSFAEYRREHPQAPRIEKLTYAHLSTLLYYSYGLSRHDTGVGVRWPFHRLVPSARCFFPAELYLWTPGAGEIPAGVYHYDNLHHSLALLRAGEYRGPLQSLLGDDLEGCAGLLFVSAYFWKNAFRYRNFSYRLCAQEAGMVVGNVQLVAGTLGLQTRVHYQFLDEPANRLLGFESGEESLFAAIALYPESLSVPHHARRAAAHTSSELLEILRPISPTHIKMSSLDRHLCSLLLTIDEHSYLESTAEFVDEVDGGVPLCQRHEVRLAPPAPLAQELELAQALHRRNSGDPFFGPLRIPLPGEIFWEIIRSSLAPYRTDCNRRSGESLIQLYVAVNNVQGLAKGVYRLCRQCGCLHVIEQRDVTAETMALHTTSAVNCATANAVCYLVADYHSIQDTLGNRAYRVMNMECGIIAQRLCALSAAFGLVARCSDSYFIEGCERFLHLADKPAMPIFLIALGYERACAGTRYRHSIRF